MIKQYYFNKLLNFYEHNKNDIVNLCNLTINIPNKMLNSRISLLTKYKSVLFCNDLYLIYRRKPGCTILYM